MKKVAPQREPSSRATSTSTLPLRPRGLIADSRCSFRGRPGVGVGGAALFGSPLLWNSGVLIDGLLLWTNARTDVNSLSAAIRSPRARTSVRLEQLVIRSVALEIAGRPCAWFWLLGAMETAPVSRAPRIQAKGKAGIEGLASFRPLG